MDPRHPILDALDAALRDVLGALGGDGGASRSRELEAARVRVDVAYLRLRAADASLGSGARPYPEDLRAKVQGVLRLDALLQSVAGEAAARVVGERARVTTLRTALRQHAREQGTGEAGRSCDVRG